MLIRIAARFGSSPTARSCANARSNRFSEAPLPVDHGAARFRAVVG